MTRAKWTAERERVYRDLICPMTGAICYYIPPARCEGGKCMRQYQRPACAAAAKAKRGKR